MKLTDFIPLNDSFGELEGVEKQLRTRRFTSTVSLWASILSAVAYAVASSKSLPFLRNSLTYVAGRLHIGTHVAFAIAAAGVCVWVFLRYTGFLFKESNEPFRYTFSVGEFKQVENTPDARFAVDQMDQLHLLRLDLIERLNRRVRRFSMLDTPKADTTESHFQIEGDYAVREDESDGWIVHVWPRVRIGADGSAYTLAYPVRLPILDGSNNETPTKGVLDLDEYQRLVERVYSSVATEIYKQIEIDLRGKMKLFPTSSLRALARYVEAEDFETSNTIDAYDRALEMYQSSLDELDASIAHTAMKWLGEHAWWPVVALSFTGIRTRMEAEAKTKVGYSRCLVYRRLVSEMGGRQRNPIYRCREYLKDAVGLLERCYDSFLLPEPLRLHRERLHRETAGAKEPAGGMDDAHAKMVLARSAVRWPLRRKRLYQQVRKELCEAYAVAALAHSRLDDSEKALAYISLAEALEDDDASDQPENSASARVPVLLLLAKAELEPTLDQRILYLTNAKELNPESEIALYRFAYNSDLLARDRNDITPGRVRQINCEYQAVLNVNPANIASIIGQGYLLWLVDDLDSARTRLLAGIELQKIVAKTFVGDLKYCLARVEAELAFGRMTKLANNIPDESRKSTVRLLHSAAMDYEQATVADSSVATGTADPQSRSSNGYYYERVNLQMLDRYRLFVQRTSRKPPKAISDEAPLDRDLTTVRSYAINDEGNAQLSYYWRFEVSTGKTAALSEARRLFAEVWEMDRDNCMLEYNYFLALLQTSDDELAPLVVKRGKSLLDNSAKLPSTSMVVVINQLVQSEASQVEAEEAEKARQQTKIDGLKAEIEALQEKIDRENKSIGSYTAGAGRAAGATASEDAVSLPKRSQHSQPSAQGPATDHVRTANQPDHEYNLADAGAPGSAGGRAREAPLPPPAAEAIATDKRMEAGSGMGIAANDLGSPDEQALVVKQRQKKDADKELQEIEHRIQEASGPLLQRLKSHEELVRKFIVNKSRLAPFADLIRTEKIRGLLDNKGIDWYDLGDIEVFALKSFASIWAQKPTPADRESSRLLYEHIIRLYTPDDFDANWTLFRMATAPDEKKAFLKTANKAVDWSRRYDSQSCFYRQWRYITFDSGLSLDYAGWPDGALGEKDCESLTGRYHEIEKDCGDQPDFHHAFAAVYERRANASTAPDGNRYGRKILDERRQACTLDRNKPVFRESYLDSFGRQLISHSTRADPMSGRTGSSAIEVELAADLIEGLGFDSGPNLPPEVTSIEKLRQALRTEFGFELPGIRFRDNGSLSAGWFRFILRGVPMPEERLNAATKAEQWTELTGRVRNMAVDRAADFHNLQYRKREFAVSGNPKSYSGIQNDPKALWALNQVLKSLLREGVPVADFSSILTEFLRCRRLGFGIMTTVAEIRALPGIREKLKGNSILDGETVEYLAPAPQSRAPRKALVIARPNSDTQNVLDAAVDWRASEPIFQASPQLAEDLRVLARRAKDQAGSQGRAVLVVPSAARPFCRKFITDRDVSILSEREILPAILSQIEDPHASDAKGTPGAARN